MQTWVDVVFVLCYLLCHKYEDTLLCSGTKAVHLLLLPYEEENENSGENPEETRDGITHVLCTGTVSTPSWTRKRDCNFRYQLRPTALLKVTCSGCAGVFWPVPNVGRSFFHSGCSALCRGWSPLAASSGAWWCSCSWTAQNWQLLCSSWWGEQRPPLRLPSQHCLQSRKYGLNFYVFFSPTKLQMTEGVLKKVKLEWLWRFECYIPSSSHPQKDETWIFILYVSVSLIQQKFFGWVKKCKIRQFSAWEKENHCCLDSSFRLLKLLGQDLFLMNSDQSQPVISQFMLVL